MELSHRSVTYTLGAPFRISRSTDVEIEVLEVEIRHGDEKGYGEAEPQDHYGESVQSAAAALDRAGTLLGNDPWAFEEIEGRLRLSHLAAIPATPATDLL